MVKSILTRLLIIAIEGINNLVGYFEHDIKRGNSRKTIAIAVVMVAIMGLSFVGTGVTGQVVKARDSAASLSEKLGDTEARYQQLSITHDTLKTEADQCGQARDQYSSDLATCRTDLSYKTSEFDVKKVQYDKCAADLTAKGTDYSTCSTQLSDKTTQLTTKTNEYNTVNTNYNNLNAKYNAVVVNVVKDYCNCNVRPAGSTINYQVTDANRVICFVTDAEKTGTVTC